MPDATLLWLYPDRDTAGKNKYAEEHYWSYRRSVAERAGFRFLLKAPQDLVLWKDEDGKIRLMIDAEEIHRDSCILVTDLGLDPRSLPDLWGCISTLLCLETAGYHLATPVHWLLLSSEKFATLNSLADLGLHSLPTLRVIPNHHLDGTGVVEAAMELGFPLVVRPASWYAGMGVCFVDTRPQLEQVLSLAAGYDQPFVIQHRLPEPLIDARAYCVDGRVLAFVERSAMPDEPLNYRTGFTTKLGTPPEFIMAAARELFRRTGLAYFSIDMLFDGTDWWLSEVEIDAGALPVGEFDDAQVDKVLSARFASYRRRLAGVHR
ncbi:RimK family alpha-L-glutamate ligase [Nocardia sp. NPDC051570]|uniref:RimK family alpha-L-glutamate ligase n=1 Tax=Nocardia sp. NPDC051570 TaxID=3364324 RepID=UPI0037996404